MGDFRIYYGFCLSIEIIVNYEWEFDRFFWGEFNDFTDFIIAS